MFVNQLSVFIENRAGRLEEVLAALKKANINIISLSLADTSEYGMLRMIVPDPENAKNYLKDNGFSAHLTPVIAVSLPHKVGGLHNTLKVLCDAGIDIEYMYALAIGGNDASIVIKPSKPKEAFEALKKCDIKVMTQSDLQ